MFTVFRATVRFLGIGSEWSFRRELAILMIPIVIYESRVCDNVPYRTFKRFINKFLLREI